MSEQGANDATRASTFTRTLHRTPASGLSPHANTLPPGLNVLVIGASRGIGASMACAYACAGAATLILAARSSSGAALAAVAEQVRAESRDAGTTTTTVLTETIDITSSDSMAQLAARVKQATQGKLDIVVFNSGYSGPIVKRVEEGDPRDFHAVFDVNVQGTYLAAHYFLPLLRESSGGGDKNSAVGKTFIAISSFAACMIEGGLNKVAYCVSKLAQARLVEYIAAQYRDAGVLAVAVHPGSVLTELSGRVCAGGVQGLSHR